jgi:hypothetical protein
MNEPAPAQAGDRIIIVPEVADNQDARRGEPEQFHRGDRGTIVGIMGVGSFVVAMDDGSTGVVPREAVTSLRGRTAHRTDDRRPAGKAW